MVLADVSMLKEEFRVKNTTGFACHELKLNESDTKASCMHENLCYALDVSTIAVTSKPLNPVKCYIKKQVLLPNKGTQFKSEEI